MRIFLFLCLFVTFIFCNVKSMQKPTGDVNSYLKEKMANERKSYEEYAKRRAEAYYDESRKFEVSNQSNQMAAIWLKMRSEREWQSITLAPEKDSGILIPLDNNPIHIYSSAGIYLLVVENSDLKLYKEVPVGPQQSKKQLIKSLPYGEAMDMLVTVDPNGSVDFAKRNRQQRDESYFVRH